MAEPDRQHLFVVRVWQEAGQGVAGDRWRGSVEHVPSGQRLYFVSLDDLTDFIVLRSKFNAPPDGSASGVSPTVR